MHTIIHYIDPGTGSMLFTVLIGLVSAGVYALRSSIIKLRFVMSGGRQDKAESDNVPFVIFSDSKRYWNVFEPVCDELEARGYRVDYLTASPDDPALERDYKNVRCEFVGEGNRAFAKLNMLKADVVFSSTPGLDVYQWKRSRDVKCYVHVLHAVTDPSMYRMFGLDYYDAVLLSGEYQLHQIRAFEKMRNLPAKDLAVLGLPHMDTLRQRFLDAPAPEDHETTVLLAPTWGETALFSLYGGDIIGSLLKTGYHVIVRPHPQSMTSEADMMNRIMGEYPESDQLEWNFDNDNFDALMRSDIMISDFSGVVFDFALVFDRPVIYTEPAVDLGPYDAWWMPENLWVLGAVERVGRKLELEHVGELKQLIDECLQSEELQAACDQVRDECWGSAC